MKSILSLLVAAAAFSPVLSTSTRSKKSCQDYKIPITVTSENFIFGPPTFKNDYDLTDFVTDLASRTASTDFHPFSGQENQTATYTLAGTFCTPKDSKAKHKSTVILATHGLNFNRGYWDPEIEPERYSFVDYAISQGYSIFFYDRLGVGKSQRVSGYLNQLPIQVALSRKLVHLIKDGKYTGSIGKPKKLVLVGHSYGSAISAATVTAEPGIADAVILTGFSYKGNNVLGFVQASQFRIAATQSPRKWRQLDSGYVTPVDIFANVNAFFKKPDYEVKVAKYADANKEPIAINELLTATLVPLEPKLFKGAAMVIAGQHDFIFCTSQCDDVIGSAADSFANAKAFKAVSYPKAGHGLNFALSAPGAFKIIIDFIDANVS